MNKKLKKMDKIKSMWLIRELYLLIRCIYKFRPILGVEVFFKLNKKNNKTSYVSINIPGFLEKINLRPGSSDIDIFEVVFIAERFKHIETKVEPKVIIDAGANIGLVSLYFARKYPDAKIFAIEPETSNYNLLTMNTKSYGNIVPIKAALWKNNSTLYIQNPNAEKWAFKVSEENKIGEYVDAITVMDILQKTSNNYIDILKIDIEGAEKEVFSENYQSWIDKINFFVIELHEGLQSGCRGSFFSAIKNLKYKIQYIGENYFVKVIS